jgi:hypothetical protein
MTISRQTKASTLQAAGSLLVMGALLVVAKLSFGALFRLMSGVPLRKVPVSLTKGAIVEILMVLVLVPGFLLAERAAISRGRGGPYTVVVLVGTALVAALVFPVLDWFGLSVPLPGVSVPLPPQVLPFLDFLPEMALVAFMYARHRERLEAAQAIQTLETRRNEMMDHLAASRLEAAHARVQPEAFIAEIRALRASYVDDPAAGGAGLEALITRLRAASLSAAP